MANTRGFFLFCWRGFSGILEMEAELHVTLYFQARKICISKFPKNLKQNSRGSQRCILQTRKISIRATFYFRLHKNDKIWQILMFWNSRCLLYDGRTQYLFTSSYYSLMMSSQVFCELLYKNVLMFSTFIYYTLCFSFLTLRTYLVDFLSK
jgi:hypothetical protein